MARPVSYPALGFLLQHLEPNLRFQLCTRCPSIQNLEKSVPLHIRYLKLTDHRIIMNGSTYLLSVFDQTRQREFDIEQYDIQDAREMEQDPNEVRLDVRLRFIVNNDPVRREGQLVIRLNRGLFDNCQLRLQTERGVEVLSYQRKMHEALKYMLGKLFGGRCVKVNQLAIGCENILRVPTSVKFHVKILEILDANVYNNLGTVCSMIEDSSLPLNTVKCRIQSFATANNPIILAAKTLHILATPTPVGGGNPFRALARQTNRRVHLEFRGGILDLWYPKVLRRWMRRGKEPGTQYTFQTEQEEIDQAMVNIRRAYWSRVQQAGNNRITLNLNETSKVVIKKFQNGNLWILEMKVESR